MKYSRNKIVFSLILFLIAADQLSKFWIRDNVLPHSETELIGRYFILTNVENSGAFLGLGSNLNVTLKIVFLWLLPILVLGYITYYVIKNKLLDMITTIGFACIIGGGIANVFDRIAYGSVTDFLHIDLGGIFKTGIFNLADVFVMIGMGLLLLSSFKKNKPLQE